MKEILRFLVNNQKVHNCLKTLPNFTETSEMITKTYANQTAIEEPEKNEPQEQLTKNNFNKSNFALLIYLILIFFLFIILGSVCGFITLILLPKTIL